MGYEKYFVMEDTVKFKIDGLEFVYKPMTAGEELDRLDEYTKIDDRGRPIQDLKRITELKLTRIIKAPFSKSFIKKLIGIDKEWEELDDNEKLQFFRKAKPNFVSKIIDKIQELDAGTEGDALKNS